MLGVGCPVAAQRARERGFLLIQVVLRLFAIELEQNLPGLNAIAKVRQKPLDATLRFGRPEERRSAPQQPRQLRNIDAPTAVGHARMRRAVRPRLGPPAAERSRGASRWSPRSPGTRPSYPR